MRESKRVSESLSWEDVPESKQLGVLADILQRRSRELRQSYPNILSVGIGRKTTAGKVRDLLSLGFLVRKKSPRARRPLPPSIATSLVFEGLRRRIQVPTDVEEVGNGGPQFGANVADGVIVASPSAPQVRSRGAICCLVRLIGQPDLFLLSCHHVLTLSGELGRCRVLRDALVADANRVPFAQLFDFVPMAAGVPSQTDAALALVQPGTSVIWDHGGVRPTAVDFGSTEPRNCTICAPPGRRISATFVKTWTQLRLPYPGCTVQIAAAYQFTANTVPGDSGSPVLGADGTLYGMHFWGDPSRNFALSIPAGLLFGPNVFGSGTLQLA